MKPVITVNHEERLVRFTIGGTMTAEEMLGVLAAGEEAVRGPGYRVLSDHRAITTPITPNQMEQVIGFLTRPTSRFRGSSCAVVVGNLVSFGMMRALGARLESSGIPVRVFEIMQDAEAWLAGRAT